jgi:hypothetical protein
MAKMKIIWITEKVKEDDGLKLIKISILSKNTNCITASGSGFHQLLAASKKRRKTPNLPKVLEPPAYQVINRCLSPLP